MLVKPKHQGHVPWSSLRDIEAKPAVRVKSDKAEFRITVT